MKRTIDQVDVRGKRVLVRCDFNVPIDQVGSITDDRRIRAALPTIAKLRDGGGRVVLMSHLGRPEDAADRARLTLRPVARRLGELIEAPVAMAEDCVGDEVRRIVDGLGDGDVALLENLRFHAAETVKDKKASGDPSLREQKEAFAQQLAEMADIYVNDAFGTCHRDNASMLTVPRRMAGRPCIVGYLVQKELQFLGDAITDPKHPFVCVLGGAKVSDKLGVIRSLLQKCDTILIGGAMAYTFFAAEGVPVGNSLVETDLRDTARALLADAGHRLRLPIDSVVATEIRSGAEVRVTEGPIADGQMGLDIGPQTIAAYGEVIRSAATIVWNGPMGVFETPPFDKGTMAMAAACADATGAGATTIIGGGDSAAAIEKAGVADRITHVSTGGGASLELLEGKRFAAIEVLDDA